jgi:hypothetical protein
MSDEVKKLIKKKVKEKNNPYNYPVGIVAFENFFSHQELLMIERNVEETENKCENRAYLPMTAQ